MGYSRKYGKVTTEHGDIPDDEPVIVFRARDMNTPEVIAAYYQAAARNGSLAPHLDLILDTQREVEEWQEQNPGKVRVPDSESSRGPLRE